MRVKKPRQPIEVICIDCGCTYIAYSTAARRCPECNLKHRRKCRQEYAESNKKEQTKPPSKPKSKPRHKPKPMSQVLKEMETYNKEHKTHYTYGQFVLLVEGGKLDGQ